MTCEEFLRVLDTRTNGEAPPSDWVQHAQECSDCAFALRLERVMRSAPAWAEKPRLSAARRALVLNKASETSYLWSRLLPNLEESALTALAGGGLVALAFYVAPKLWATSVPEGLRRAVAPYAAPVVEGFHTLASPFIPILHQPWGVGLLGLTGFVVLFAAVLSARTLSIRPAWLRPA
jgi:hypothetical protein